MIKAELLLDKKTYIQDKNTFIKLRVWKVPKSRFFQDGIKYSFALIHNGKRVLGYDNERGKGHHRHSFGKEESIKFVSQKEPQKKFLKEVKELEKILGD